MRKGNVHETVYGRSEERVCGCAKRKDKHCFAAARKWSNGSVEIRPVCGFFEDDVSYFGDKNLFDSIDFNCDALFQNKRVTVEEDEWWWWYHSEYKIDRNKIQKTFHGLLNIYGCKQHIINEFINFLSEDNYIHHELLLSGFILNNCNIKVNYIDDYLKCYFTYINKYSLEKKYDLIHPVKTLEKYNFLNNLK